MNIQSVRLYSFELKLKRPIVVRGRNLAVRQGYIVELQAGPILGYGEISPLEGFSPESLDEVQQQIKQLRHFLLSDPIPDNVEFLEGRFQDWLGNFALHPSVACGLEMAVLNLMANSRNLTLKELLAETSHSHIPINGLLQGEPALILEQARQMVAEGFTALKLKVGTSLEADIKLVRAVSEAIGGKALLHLDANRSWSLEEAIYFGTQVGLASVDYIEEPLSTYEEIPEFFRQTTIPVALDETLADVSFKDIKSLDGVDVLVLKPSRIGGIEKTWCLIREAKAQGIST
ncbi:MAG: o-succinylbenzoate synthase, partial [Candidatus Omnitrophica bacterium]|nr:o-succinylbenzoate synthase [Candidatus Omnitrophota bacterium]